MSNATIAVALVIVSSACAPAEELPTKSAAPKESLPPVVTENPFTRPSFEAQMPQCTTVTLEVAYEATLSAVSIVNRCDHAVAVLTSPIEIRVRRTGTEKFTYERTRWAAYALLYVVSAELGNDAFRGDGVIRDGGLRVSRAPRYVTIPGRETVKLAMQCTVDVPAGRYSLAFVTYEAPQGEAPSKADAIDCKSTVASHNIGVETAAHVTLGGDVREVHSASAMLEVRARKYVPRRRASGLHLPR